MGTIGGVARMVISHKAADYGRALFVAVALGSLASAGAVAQDRVSAPRTATFQAPDYWSARPSFLPEGPVLKVGHGSALGEAEFLASPDSINVRKTASDLPGALAGADYLAGPAQPEKDGPWPGFGPADLALTMAKIDKEIGCLALNIYFEARSESESGMLAVGKVVMNRVADGRFPGTVCDVIRQGGEVTLHRCQFSWWCDGQSDLPLNSRSWQLAQSLARDIYWNRVDDPSGGALWYHADYVSPYWRTAFKRGPQIGRHIFYADKAKRRNFANRPQTASLQ